MQALDGGRQSVRLNTGEHNFHARFREGPAEREADTTRPSRHERRLAGELCQ
jgi:hypothetical protein